MRKYVLFVLFVVLVLQVFAGTNTASAIKPSDVGLKEGDLISAMFSDDPDVYIINEHGYKRLFLNPEIFKFYTHLGGFANIKLVTPEIRDAFTTSGYFKNCETGDPRVFGVEVRGEDAANLRWVNTSGEQATRDDPDFFKKVFCINAREFRWYAQGQSYGSVRDVPRYVRPAPVPFPSPRILPSPIPASTVTVTSVVAHPSSTNPQVWAVDIGGYFPNPCHSLLPPTSTQTGNSFDVTLLARSSNDGACVQVVRNFSKTVDLHPGPAMIPGTYTVSVNGQYWATFTVPGPSPTPTCIPLPPCALPGANPACAVRPAPGVVYCPIVPITIIAPQQGDRWVTGTSYRISWQPFPSTSDTFIYLSGGGNAEGYSKYIGSPSVGNSFFYYNVTENDLPVMPGYSWKVAVCDGKLANGGSNCGWSGEVFVTRGVPSPTLYVSLDPSSPASGTVIPPGTTKATLLKMGLKVSGGDTRFSQISVCVRSSANSSSGRLLPSLGIVSNIHIRDEATGASLGSIPSLPNYDSGRGCWWGSINLLPTVIIPNESGKVLSVIADVSNIASIEKIQAGIVGMAGDPDFPKVVGLDVWGNGLIVSPFPSPTPFPAFTVFYPNGGETFVMGNSYRITWTPLSGSNVAPNVVITLLKSGAPWLILDSVPQSSGFYVWTVPIVPNLTGNDFKMHIQGMVNGTTVTDTSDAPFSIVTGPTTTIPTLNVILAGSTPPSGIWRPGQTSVRFAEIKASAGSSPVNNLNSIQIGSDSPNASAFLSNIRLFDGPIFLGSLPELSWGGAYYQGWIPVSGITIPANSAKVFTVIADIKPTAPAGPVRLGIAGWNFNPPGANVVPFGTPIYGNSMTITAATSTIRIDRPTTGNVLTLGDPSYTIAWTTLAPLPFSPVDILLIKRSLGSGGAFYVARGVPNQGWYNWDTTRPVTRSDGSTQDLRHITGDDFSIHISMPGTSAWGETGAFSVINAIPTPTPGVTVLYPNGGEQQSTGQQSRFEWRTSGLTRPICAVDLYRFGVGSPVKNIVTNYEAFQDGTSYFYWPISSDLVSGQYKALVRCVANGGNTTYADESDNYFTITATTPTPTPSVLSIQAPENPTIAKGVAYTGLFLAAGGQPWYGWIVGALPPGLKARQPCPGSCINPTYDTTIVEGTPTTLGSFPVLFQVFDRNGNSVSKTVTFIITTAVGSTTPTFNRNLGIRLWGDDVRALQQALTQRGLLAANLVTGFFGSQTEKAVKDFQWKNKIPSTGIVGPSTRELLQVGQ